MPAFHSQMRRVVLRLRPAALAVVLVLAAALPGAAGAVPGDLDPSFGGDGKVAHSYPGAGANALALGRDGAIVVAGGLDIFEVALARYTPRGRLDPSFGGDGRVRISVGSGEQAAVGVDVLGNGRVVGAAYVGPHEAGGGDVFRFAVFRLLTNGRLDPAFSDRGVLETRIGGGALATGAALAATWAFRRRDLEA